MRTQSVLILSLIALTMSGQFFEKPFKYILYYPNSKGDITEKVQWNRITHISYAFAYPDSKGKGKLEDLTEYDSVITSLISAATTNEVEPILSVGGKICTDGMDCAQAFASNTDSGDKVSSLAQSIMDTAKQYGFKGIDIVWMYPNSNTENNYLNFIRQMKNLCTSNSMTLTVAVPPLTSTGYNKEIFTLVDNIIIMAFDGDNGAGNTPFSLVENAFKYWTYTEKQEWLYLFVTIPLFAEPGMVPVNEIVQSSADNAKADTCQINGNTVYYNGLGTANKKAGFIATNMGGCVLWDAGMDLDDPDDNFQLRIGKNLKSLLG